MVLLTGSPTLLYLLGCDHFVEFNANDKYIIFEPLPAYIIAHKGRSPETGFIERAQTYTRPNKKKC